MFRNQLKKKLGRLPSFLDIFFVFFVFFVFIFLILLLLLLLLLLFFRFPPRPVGSSINVVLISELFLNYSLRFCWIIIRLFV